MDNLVSETNLRLQEVIDNLATIKKEYEKKLKANDKQINSELAKVKKYKKDFFEAKEKVEKMNADIVGFSEDYKKLVERFKANKTTVKFGGSGNNNNNNTSSFKPIAPIRRF